MIVSIFVMEIHFEKYEELGIVVQCLRVTHLRQAAKVDRSTFHFVSDLRECGRIAFAQTAESLGVLRGKISAVRRLARRSGI
jgi:hypothetical protein